MSIEPRSVRIRRLRVATATPDALAMRLRLDNAVAQSDFYPPGLEATAILVVRRLSRRRIGWPSPKASHPIENSLWEQAVRSELEELARRAVRPARSPAPANADAVVFNDRAELLACLARDWLNGDVVSRWWWKSLFQGADWNSVIRSTWLEAPEHVPAALAHLASTGEVESFVRALGGGPSESLLRKVATTHALARCTTTIGGPLFNKRDTPRPTNNDQPLAMEAQSSPEPTAPWQRWVSEANVPGLDTSQRCLIGIALMIARAPNVVRGEAFARELLNWRSTMERVAVVEQPRGTHDREAMTGLGHANGGSAAPTAPVLKPVFNTTSSPASSDLPATNPSAISESDPRWHAAAAAPTFREIDSDHNVGLARPPGGDRPVPRGDSPPVSRERLTTTTELGGLFYLINLGLFLELYGDFTCPTRPSLALPIWDFLFLVGRRLLAAERDSDAVWNLLASLAGRDAGTLPGLAFEPPAVWHLPEDWLRPFPPSGSWSWNANAERLWVCHPRGFRVFDVPRDQTDALDQLAAELNFYGEANPRIVQRDVASGPIRCDSPLDRWLDWLLPYVRARLARALGVVGTDGVAELLLAHRARLEVTATHLDVKLSLAELPCAIRLAGLDRDPGWVPAASRYVAFHFE